MEVALDIDAMQADLVKETDEALELADRLAAEMAGASAMKTPAAIRIAGEYEEKRALVRRLRRAIKAEVAG